MAGEPARRELTEEWAEELLREACRKTGLSPDGARLMRIGSNAVYHLATPVVARISRRDADATRAGRTVAVARWLEDVGYPAVRAIHVDQPVDVDGHTVTFWQSVSEDGEQYASIGQVAEVLAELHRLTPPAELHLPNLDPFANAANRIQCNTWLSSGDRAFLDEQLSAMREKYASLDFALPPGVIHGDANIGNVLRDAHGEPVVIDLDGFAIGPREWDLILTAIYFDSFGWHTQKEYETFVRVYGFDIRQWDRLSDTSRST